MFIGCFFMRLSVVKLENVFQTNNNLSNFYLDVGEIKRSFYIVWAFIYLCVVKVENSFWYTWLDEYLRQLFNITYSFKIYKFFLFILSVFQSNGSIGRANRQLLFS